jgi:uncharacterized protein with HEPN domain
MTTKRSCRVYVEDIQVAIGRITQYTEDGKEAFLHDEKTQDAVIRQISIIGEAAARLPPSFRKAFPDIPWRKIVGMRNILVHEYSTTSIHRVWSTVQDHIPRLSDAIPRMLKEADPEEKRQRRAA